MVVVNLTATNTTATGYLAAIPGSSTCAGTSNDTSGPGQSPSNRVIVPLAGGTVTIVNASGYTDFAIDVSGWFTDGSNPAASGGVYTPVPPSRLFDTRNGYGPLGPGGIRPLPGARRHWVARAGTTAAAGRQPPPPRCRPKGDPARRHDGGDQHRGRQRDGAQQLPGGVPRPRP